MTDNRIREWRRVRGFTLEYLADKLGISAGALSLIERGKRHYDQRLLEAISAVMRVSLSDLVSDEIIDLEITPEVSAMLNKALRRGLG